MVQNFHELTVASRRLAYLYQLVAQLRVSIPVENFHAMSGGYITEIERMHAEVLAYLKHHASEQAAA